MKVHFIPTAIVMLLLTGCGDDSKPVGPGPTADPIRIDLSQNIYHSGEMVTLRLTNDTTDLLEWAGSECLVMGLEYRYENDWVPVVDGGPPCEFHMVRIEPQSSLTEVREFDAHSLPPGTYRVRTVVQRIIGPDHHQTLPIVSGEFQFVVP